MKSKKDLKRIHKEYLHKLKNYPSDRFQIEILNTPTKLIKYPLCYKGDIKTCIELLESKGYEFIYTFFGLKKDTEREKGIFITFEGNNNNKYSILPTYEVDYEIICEKRMICDSFEMFERELGKYINNKLLIKKK